MRRSGIKNNPVPLFINYESRVEALERYNLASTIDRIYIDFSQDTLFIDSVYSIDRYITCKTDYESRIEILTVDLQSFIDEKDFILIKVRQFHKLRKLVLIIPKQFYLLGTTFIYYRPALVLSNITFIEVEEEHLPEIKAIIKDIKAIIRKIITI
jgi:hypothetical protein